jgi:hypothetical protein
MKVSVERSLHMYKGRFLNGVRSMRCMDSVGPCAAGSWCNADDSCFL